VPVGAAAEDTTRVTVLAASTRRRSPDAGEMFSGERADVMSYASVTVSIPPDEQRKIGEVQWPSSSPGDSSRDFVTVSTNYLDKRNFASAIAAQVKQSRRSKILIFVHGFNNRFDDAVYRLAQIVHDSKAQAIPILFTWPSRGQVALRAYTYDRESANYSRDAFEDVLTTLEQQPGITEINVLAHSMGTWIALEALRVRSLRAGRSIGKIKNVMLVAPDVDVDVFRTQVQRMGTHKPRLVLFVSQDDKALGLSQFIWGGVQRLGEVNPNQEPYQSQFRREQIEVFDLTTMRATDAHDKAFENLPSVVSMMRQRFHAGQDLSTRQPDAHN